MSDASLNNLDSDQLRVLENFANPAYKWRRILSELFGTFLLVMVAAGGGMMAAAFPGTLTRTALVVAPGLMVMAIILFMGKISGAHLNPAVSFAFALRGDFPWKRVMPYVIAQILGALLAVLILQVVIGVSARNGASYPGSGVSIWAALTMEILLTFGLVSVILGTASGAQNIGPIGALAVGGYIALAGLWASPLSGGSMNPVRSFAPDLVSGDFTSYWIYLLGPLVGATLAVGMAYALRGPGGGASEREAAEGSAAVARERLQVKSRLEESGDAVESSVGRGVDDVDRWIESETHLKNKVEGMVNRQEDTLGKPESSSGQGN